MAPMLEGLRTEEWNWRRCKLDLLYPQLFPLPVHRGLRLLVHLDLIRPRTRKALARPLSRRVNAHLRPVVWQPRGVVKRINRAHSELDIAFRVDVVEDLQR